jgi:hypothetical protein
MTLLIIFASSTAWMGNTWLIYSFSKSGHWFNLAAQKLLTFQEEWITLLRIVLLTPNSSLEIIKICEFDYFFFACIFLDKNLSLWVSVSYYS